MQQRQLRLGDILDDYCPRERRLTNHAVVAMVGEDVKRTRCTTCEAEHEYKEARIPKQRRKDSIAAVGQGSASSAMRIVASAPASPEIVEKDSSVPLAAADLPVAPVAALISEVPVDELLDSMEEPQEEELNAAEEGPAHRRLIRATLPRPEGQAPARPASDFTIRQPNGRGGRFRPRHQRADRAFQGNRGHGDSNGNIAGPSRNGPRQNGGRAPLSPRFQNRRGPGRGRPK